MARAEAAAIRTLGPRLEPPPASSRSPSGLVRFARHASVVAGLYLNAYALHFDGEVELWRLPRGEDEDKREREQALASRPGCWSSTRSARPTPTGAIRSSNAN